MKRLQIIAILLLIVLAACNSKKQVPEPEVAEQSRNVEGPSKELCAIDSLMWRQPDSALTVLMDYFDDDSRDAARHVSTTGTFENHYANLLLAELLFKNYAFQTNRTQLLEAVSYFDSLVRQAPPFKGAGEIKKDLTPNLVFLDARAHYINGVGYYEHDSVVEACKEYLKALEVMEEHFEEKELVEHKARFLVYSYNRLGDLFSEQFMMESAITCYENALVYCKIYPTSSTGVSNTLYRIGKQYDKNNEIENASLYYGQAIENMTATDNMVYRDIVASKALCDYKSGATTESFLDELYLVLKCSDTEKERLNRYLTIGCVFFYEGNYDSALFYLEPVFEDNEAGLQAQAAGYLRIIYDSIGNKERSDAYMRFLTNNKKPEGENKALVSKLEDMYKNYSNQKLEKQAKAEQKTAEKRVMNTIIPIAVAIALIIICVLIWRSRRLLKNQQEEADRELKDRDKRHAEAIEAERQAHRMEQAALSGRLKRSNAALREKEKMEYFDRLSKQSHYDRAENYFDEPICQRILSTCNDKNNSIKSSIPVSSYVDIALTDAQKVELKNAALAHYASLFKTLKQQHPELKEKDFLYCYLSLLGLDNAQIAVLTQLSYRTVWEREKRLQHIFQKEDRISIILNEMMTD